MQRLLTHGMPSAGLVLGPAAWALNQGLNYAIVPWICAHKVNPVLFLALGLALVALSGAFLSWRAFLASGEPVTPSHAGGRPHHFLAGMSLALALLFTLVILTQGAAGLAFHGCER
jgi:hypothetical protein